MKITYPEFTLEITAEELITVMDRLCLFSAGARLVQEIESYKQQKEDPAPVPYPQEEEHTATYEPGGIIGNGESEPSGEKVIRMSKEMKRAIVEKTPYVGKKKPSGKAKKVDVLFDTGWKTFRSMGAAAKAINARLNHLSHALLNGKTCNGHQVRYSNPELDAALAEIEEGKKQPYQPTPPVR